MKRIVYGETYNLVLLEQITEKVAVYKIRGCLGTEFKKTHLGTILITKKDSKEYSVRWLWKNKKIKNPATLHKLELLLAEK